MSEVSPPKKPAEHTAVLYWASPYVLCVALLYLWGFWVPFGVNILEHISLTDVVKAAALPTAFVFLSLVVGLFLGELLTPPHLLPPGGGRATSTGAALVRFVRPILYIYSVAVVLFALFGPLEKWRVLPVLIAVPVAALLQRTSLLAGTLHSDRARGSVLLLLAGLPPTAYGYGQFRADDIVTGHSYSYVTSPIEGVMVSDSAKPSQRPRYLGRAGDSYFVFLPEPMTTVVVPASSVKALHLQRIAPVSSSQQGASAPRAASK